MTIVFLTRLFHPHIGGVEKHVWEISHILAKMGHKIVIITENTQYSPHEFIDCIEVYRFNPGREDWYKKFRIWKWMLQHQHIFRSAQIIHCHDVFFWYLPLRLIFFTKKIFTTFHGYETRFPIKRSAIIVRKVSEILSNGNICVGDYISKWYKTKLTYTTYGGVRFTKIYNTESKKLTLGFVGRISEDNGVSIYEKALNELKKLNIAFSFLVFGDGNEKEKFATYGKLMGMVNPDISSVEILFASSYLSILEGLINKKLIIAVYNNELKKDYLMLSPFSKYIMITNNPHAIVETVNKYVQSSGTFENRLIEGYEFAKEQTWEKVAEIYVKLWKL